MTAATSTVDLTVGVLGGMGPAATLDFFAKLLARNPGDHDQDRLRILIDNNPKVPNRNQAVAGRGVSPAPLLAAMAAGLQRSGADFLVMPCNAAHAFVSAIEEAVTVPFVSIIEETTAEVLRSQPDLSRVGVLAAAGCLDAGLYRNAFAERGVAVSEPGRQQRERFMELLYRVKTGERGPAVREPMIGIAEELIADGAQAIVAGCTEVPLVLSNGDLSCPLIDSSDVLASATVAYATGERDLTTVKG